MEAGEGSKRTVASDAWMPARLIPVAGIRGQEEQEIRGASSLLAVMGAVDEFGRSLLKEIGAPAGRISTYTEVPLKTAGGKTLRPDGAIVVERGQTRWRCLVEVKTDNAPLRSEQINDYLDLAREHGFDAVMTISNQITDGPEDVPVEVDGRKLRRVALVHLSWWRILTEAVLQCQHRGVKDPDQAWILNELIAYLAHEKSGAVGFEDMGKQWVTVRNAARDGTIRATDPGVRDVVDRWEQFMEYLCLSLSQELGVQVLPTQSKAKSAARSEALLRTLCDGGRLSGSFRVPAAVGPIEVEADLRARQTRTNVKIGAPRDGRPLTRVNWILKQLKKAPDDLRIEVQFARTKETTAQLLSEVREDAKLLLSPTDPKREPRAFILSLARPLGTKRGRGERSFVHETQRQVVSFYGDLVENLKDWQAKAPRLPEAEAEDEPASDDDPRVSESPPSAFPAVRPPEGTLGSESIAPSFRPEPPTPGPPPYGE